MAGVFGLPSAVRRRLQRLCLHISPLGGKFDFSHGINIGESVNRVEFELLKSDFTMFTKALIFVLLGITLVLANPISQESFPFNFYYPGKYEKQAKDMLEALHPTKEDKAAESSIYSKAQKCLTTLSTRLGESDYFFGSVPTTFDALVFSYLAPLLKVPLPSCSLQNHLKACENLVKFVTRILQKYFEYDYQEYEKSKTKEQEEKKKANSDSEFPNKRRNQILAGIFAAVAMLGYALSTGIVQVQDSDYDLADSMNYVYEDEEEDDED